MKEQPVQPSHNLFWEFRVSLWVFPACRLLSGGLQMIIINTGNVYAYTVSCFHIFICKYLGSCGQHAVKHTCLFAIQLLHVLNFIHYFLTFGDSPFLTSEDIPEGVKWGDFFWNAGNVLTSCLSNKESFWWKWLFDANLHWQAAKWFRIRILTAPAGTNWPHLL